MVDLFREETPVRISTRNGISFDLPGLTIHVNDTTNVALPSSYQYPEMVDDYVNRLLGSGQGDSMLYHRLYHWRGAGHPEVDQMSKIKELLRIDRNTRSAVFATWQPDEDLGSQYPISPVAGCFRIISNILHVFLTARSTDVMVGLVPELIAWARFANDFTHDVGAERSVIHYHCWSLHLYEIDFVSHFSGTGS
ncbi:thymidylate synthase [Streptomyces aureus]|uniref:thymidylate synthase n=1 Tax=Streptomyces aureus TaxID=193461 RepID=UPI003405CD69